MSNKKKDRARPDDPSELEGYEFQEGEPLEAPQAAPAAQGEEIVPAPAPKPASYPPLLAREPSEAEVRHLGKAIQGVIVMAAGMGYDKAALAVLDVLRRPIPIS